MRTDTLPGEASVQARQPVREAAPEEREWVLDFVETILVYNLPRLTRE